MSLIDFICTLFKVKIMTIKKNKKLKDDVFLKPFQDELVLRENYVRNFKDRITENKMSLEEFSNAHEYFGLHKKNDHWIFREWAPNATAIYLVGDFSNWKIIDEFALNYGEQNGVWEIDIPLNKINHQDLYKLKIYWPGGEGERIPAYATRVVQDSSTYIFSAQVWDSKPYQWKYSNSCKKKKFPFIYEAHVGMAQEEDKIGSYWEFQNEILPRIIKSGYNTLQLMAVMEHPYYGSFGYHVSNFYAASSRFGTPEELKTLIDECHKNNISVIIDLIHSHSVKNEVEGLSRFDGTKYQYFHAGARGYHDTWDSRCFDYGKPEVIHFLLSNIKYWLEEFNIDGFRFDGVTSMLYHHRGLGKEFKTYDDYFDGSIDLDAFSYVTLANELIHSLNPNAITIAEEVSGLPGLGSPIKDGGCGFDFRLSMGIPECWFKLVTEVSDENWDLDYLFNELTNKRDDESSISYVESHDQALVGGKTLIFELMDKDMYLSMHKSSNNLIIDRGMALHKMARLLTISLSNSGYLNFMGNEFGHPEWIDFPREGNGWTYHYARRQWSLVDDENLKFKDLDNFDKAIVNLFKNENILKNDVYNQQIDNQKKIISFERGDYVFCLNFHPNESQTDFKINVSGQKYELIFNTDILDFGGYEIIKNNKPYKSMGRFRKKFIKVYIPARTAIILKKSSSKFAYLLDS